MAEPEKKIEISQSTFEQFKNMGSTLLDQKKTIDEYKGNFNKLAGCVIAFTNAFGLNTPDGKAIRPSILNGDEDPMGALLKQIIQLGTDAALASSPTGLGKRKKLEMEQRFEFFKELPGIVEFHQQQNQKQ